MDKGKLNKDCNCKRVSHSLAEQVHVLTMKTLNGNERLSGAQLMEWIDEVSVVVARRHAGSDVTTMKVQNLQFLRAAINKDTVIVKGRIVYAGRSSMMIRVDTFIERFCGEQTKIATADVWMVALDEDEKPYAVPKLILETEEEKKQFLMAESLKNASK